MKNPPATAFAGLLALTAALPARADPPAPTIDFTGETQHYKCNYPSAWRRINPQHIGGAELSLTPDGEKIETRFAIRYIPNPPDGKDRTNADIEQFLLTSFKLKADLSLEKAEDVKLDGRPARKLRISHRSKDASTPPMTQHVVYCKTLPATYLIMIAAPTEKIPTHDPGYATIVNSFQFTSK